MSRTSRGTHLARPELRPLRKLALILAAALLAGIGAVAPASAPTASAATGPKVAIIVGATHGLTANYRSYADQVYAEAIKYTSNVVKVYSPDATWTRVKAAVNGASIIVYMGHGNGWPSPYTYDPSYATRDGFGLNYDLNGDGKLSDYENKYYGEPSIRTLTPAPNAVVLLFHLCYAAGSSEPGGVAPSLSTALQRVDNYAAAFLRTSARAVVAIGHSHDPYYIRELFTSRQTIEQYFSNAPDFNANLLSFESTRTPGFSIRMDPDEPTSGYYRALTGKMSLTTSQITGAAFADTSADPASFVVPGNASPVSDGAPVYGSVENAVNGLEPVVALATTDMVRIDAQASVSSLVDGSPVFRVHTDQGIEGWMTGAALRPRDSAAPRIWEVDDGTGAFSPNGDGSRDTYQVSVRLSEPSSWTLRIEDASGQERARQAGGGDTAELTWAPEAGSEPDGEYRWVVEAEDASGNGPVPADGSFEIDTRAPDVSVADAATDVVPVFSPNGDGYGDTIAFAVGASEPGRVVGTVRDDGNREVVSTAVSVGSATASLTWDGRDASGATVADGTYALVFAAEDRAGNRSESQTRTVAVYGSLSRVRVSTSLFYPQDGDNLAARVTLAFDLARASTVTLSVANSAGSVVRTILKDQPLEAGPRYLTWDGRNDAGALVARGVYSVIARAVQGDLVVSQSASVRADAFRIVVSDTTPYRGQRITVTITTAESLTAAPRLAVYQPGISGWSVGTTRVSAGVYRVTIRLKSSATGSLRLKAYGTDSGGRSQYSSLYVPLH
ncbi:MAG: FlgD immunoglobulin-like domain containing protein [Chloroflexota bacterium]|nr:FlgD immunoglobulin-like domain containing protein [Chloroflexota bacterium]